MVGLRRPDRRPGRAPRGHLPGGVPHEPAGARRPLHRRAARRRAVHRRRHLRRRRCAASSTEFCGSVRRPPAVLRLGGRLRPGGDDGPDRDAGLGGGPQAGAADAAQRQLALGGSHAQTVLRVTVPAALPAIITGVFLAIARIAGETAPLLLTAGDQQSWPQSLDRLHADAAALHLRVRHSGVGRPGPAGLGRPRSCCMVVRAAAQRRHPLRRPASGRCGEPGGLSRVRRVAESGLRNVKESRSRSPP